MKNDLENEVNKKDKKVTIQASIYKLSAILVPIVSYITMVTVYLNYSTWHNKCFLIDWLIDYHHGIRTHDLSHKAGASCPLGYGGSRW